MKYLKVVSSRGSLKHTHTRMRAHEHTLLDQHTQREQQQLRGVVWLSMGVFVTVHQSINNATPFVVLGKH